jgi:hypothetical protein
MTRPLWSRSTAARTSRAPVSASAGKTLCESTATRAGIKSRWTYAGVFEDGAKVQGNPFLWLPLATTPQKIGRNKVTPRRIAAITPGDLVSFRSRTGTPLMGATVRVSRTQAVKDRPRVTLAALRRGREGTGVLRTIPLFFGIRVAEIRRQLNIREICERARDRIPRFYARNFRAEA